LHAGVLPKCYENSTVSVELQGDEKHVLSCFRKNDDGTVTCPMGNILMKTRTRGANTIYSSRAACRKCTNKCTISEYKNVAFDVLIRIANVLDVTADELLAGNQIHDHTQYQSDVCRILDDCTNHEKCIIVENMRSLKDILRENTYLLLEG